MGRVGFDGSLTFSIKEIFGITLIIIISFLIRVLLMFLPSFQSDESIYVYAGFAISKGVIPYREILLGHFPIMYITYAAIVQLFGSSLIHIRLFTAILFSVTVFQTFLLSKILLGRIEKLRYAVIASFFYSIFPFNFFLQLSITSTLDIILTFFILNSCIAYTIFCKSKNLKLLLLTGLFMGCALMTTMRALFFIIPLFLFHIISAWHNRINGYKSIFNGIGILLLGSVIPVAIVLSYVAFVWNALPNFLLELFYLQSIMIQMTYEEKFLSLISVLSILSPLIFLGSIRSIFHIKKARNERNSPFILIDIICLSSAILIGIIPRTLFPHYFLSLTPFLSFLAAVGLCKVINEIARIAVNRLKIKRIHLFLRIAVMLSILLVFSFLSGSQTFYFLRNDVIREFDARVFQTSQYDQAEYEAARYIASITGPSDKIWTSEGAIAFFSQRLVLPPNSSDWPVACFFPEFLGYVQKIGYWELEYRGGAIKDYHTGLLTVNQFIQSWETNKVKVIVFITGTGWVPYPDTLLYEGFRDQQGAKNYVQQKYELKWNITVPTNPYTYQIWIRKGLE